MANQPLAFAALIGGGVLITAAITGRSVAEVVSGQVHTLSQQAAVTDAGLPGALSTSPAASDIPASAVASGVRTTGLQPKVVAAIVYAHAHGWRGQVISGVRTYAEQAALYAKYLAGGHIAAKPGTGEHEVGGAVDVTDAAGFTQALASAPASIRLVSGASFGDPNHFSVNGH